MRTAYFTFFLLLFFNFIMVQDSTADLYSGKRDTFQFFEKGSASLTAEQKSTIQQLTSIFENGTLAFQYSYIEDIGDGAGVTCGRAGFTGKELLTLVKEYVKLNPLASAIASYIPCLELKGELIMNDYGCLFPNVSPNILSENAFRTSFISKSDFGKAWVDASHDVLMRQVQDDYVERVYYQPALEKADACGLHSALAVAAMYDSLIQMEDDTIDRMIRKVQQEFALEHENRNMPVTASEEAQWLRHFHTLRKLELTKSENGVHTVYRVDALAQILESQNLDLIRPIRFFDSQNGEPFEIR